MLLLLVSSEALRDVRIARDEFDVYSGVYPTSEAFTLRILVFQAEDIAGELSMKDSDSKCKCSYVSFHIDLISTKNIMQTYPKKTSQPFAILFFESITTS